MTTIDLRTIPVSTPSLCIPRVFPNIGEKRIRSIFNDLNLGEIDRVDIVSKTSDKGEKFNRIFIHFKRWGTEGNAEVARQRLLNGQDIKIVYDDPWFWKISAYRPPAIQSQSRDRRAPRLELDDTDLPRQRPEIQRPENQRPEIQRPENQRPERRRRNDRTRPTDRPRHVDRTNQRRPEMNQEIVPHTPPSSPPHDPETV